MNSVPFTIDEDSKVKRYYQLYSFFAEYIAEGKIPAGEKLPSIRTVAEELNIGRNTVVKAYELLEEEGFIFSYEKSGFFVKDRTASAFIQQNLQKPESETVPTVDSIVRNRKGTDAKSGLKAQAFSEFTDLIAETSRPPQQKDSSVSQSELDAVLRNRDSSKDTERTERRKQVKESVDEKVASVMQQIDWGTDDDDDFTLTQEELDAVLRSGVVQKAPKADPQLDKQLADIMEDIRWESQDDGSQTLSQSELDAITSSAAVIPEQEELSHTDMDSAIDMGTDDDIIQKKENFTMTDTDSPFGEEHFRSTVTEFLSLHKKIHCTPKQLVAGANIEELIANTLLTLRSVRESQPKAERPRGLLRLAQLAEAGQLHSVSAEEEKEIIAIPDDSAGQLQFLKDVGFEVRELFCDIHGVTPAELEDSGATVLVMTSTSASAKRRAELLDWANAKPNRYIIEYDKDAHGAVPALQSEDKKGKVIYAGSASDMVPKFHSCWAILPEQLLDAYESQFSAEVMELSPQEQNKLVEFIESGELDQYLSAREYE